MRCKKIIMAISIIVFALSGCDSKSELQNNEAVSDNDKYKQEIFADSENLAEGYRDIYVKAENAGELDTLEIKQEIIDYFKKEGYAAIDQDNQINMANSEKIEQFCQKVKDKQEASSVIFSIVAGGDFIRYDMETDNGEINVIVSNLEWKEGSPQADYFHQFQAYTWLYSENGYFFIEEYHMDGYDGAPGRIGFRVKPLDQTCRELNRQYVLPVGYELNKLLITDWHEDDYSNLDFYDLYERMYYLKYDSSVPYEDNYGGKEYEVPKADFEEVIKTYFQIDSEVIEQNMVYHADTQTYRYRPRGLYDCELPYGPYPEVIAYEEQVDGTIKLTVNAVWIRKELDRAITSELVVRPLENGGFQYVSNQVIPLTDSIEPEWYQERLSDEEWIKNYGEGK